MSDEEFWEPFAAMEAKGRAIRRGRRKRLPVEIKQEVMTHYGGGICACVKCGYSDIRALSIDHINGYGAEERRALGWGRRGGKTLYTFLYDNGYPPGYQTLCMNCQWIKRVENKECTGSGKYSK